MRKITPQIRITKHGDMLTIKPIGRFFAMLSRQNPELAKSFSVKDTTAERYKISLVSNANIATISEVDSRPNKSIIVNVDPWEFMESYFGSGSGDLLPISWQRVKKWVA